MVEISERIIRFGSVIERIPEKTGDPATRWVVTDIRPDPESQAMFTAIPLGRKKGALNIFSGASIDDFAVASVVSEMTPREVLRAITSGFREHRIPFRRTTRRAMKDAIQKGERELATTGRVHLLTVTGKT